MAEEDNAQEKTEQATPRRLEKAREDGQVPRSRELATAAVLLSGCAGLLLFGRSVGETLLNLGRTSFHVDRAEAFDSSQLGIRLSGAAIEIGLGLMPFFMLVLVAALLAPMALGGFLLSSKALAPKFSRLNPLEGLKRMVSLKALVELLKSVAKVVVVASVAGLILYASRADLITIGMQGLRPAIHHSLSVIVWSALGISAATLLIVAVDVPFQLFDHNKKLKMTRQQIKDEMKDTEGKPEVKGRIRQLQREMARSRMMAKVPEADVVITNPTHFSVALRYETAGSGAPVVVAKGTDLLALKIREIAVAHSVPVVSTPPLARAVYYSTEVDQEIPRGLYVAVAQVLAYIFHLRSYRRGRGDKPTLAEDLPIPEDFQR